VPFRALRARREEYMLLNRVEAALMNNPLRAAIQRRFEAVRLLRMGGPLPGGAALEIGCGRGVGVELVLDVFGADVVDAFDLDSRMVALASERLASRGRRARLWVGDATTIPVADASYDAVFDFGIVHHIPRWRGALTEIRRVLKPGGRLYSEEVLARFIQHPVTRTFLEHPQDDRFDRDGFSAALMNAGLEVRETMELWGAFAWFIAEKPSTSTESASRRHSQEDRQGHPSVR
jgi:ubiquinone/menaquinone biosynthesis C-methylase UbiE